MTNPTIVRGGPSPDAAAERLAAIRRVDQVMVTGKVLRLALGPVFVLLGARAVGVRLNWWQAHMVHAAVATLLWRPDTERDRRAIEASIERGEERKHLLKVLRDADVRPSRNLARAFADAPVQPTPRGGIRYSQPDNPKP